MSNSILKHVSKHPNDPPSNFAEYNNNHNSYYHPTLQPSRINQLLQTPQLPQTPQTYQTPPTYQSTSIETKPIYNNMNNHKSDPFSHFLNIDSYMNIIEPTSSWIRNPKMLFQSSEFIPTENMTNNERINAMTRMVILISIVLCCMRFKLWWVFLIVAMIVVIIISAIIGGNREHQTKIEYLRKPDMSAIIQPPNNTTHQSYNNSINSLHSGSIINPIPKSIHSIVSPSNGKQNSIIHPADKSMHSIVEQFNNKKSIIKPVPKSIHSVVDQFKNSNVRPVPKSIHSIVDQFKNSNVHPTSNHSTIISSDNKKNNIIQPSHSANNIHHIEYQFNDKNNKHHHPKISQSKDKAHVNISTHMDNILEPNHRVYNGKHTNNNSGNSKHNIDNSSYINNINRDMHNTTNNSGGKIYNSAVYSYNMDFDHDDAVDRYHNQVHRYHNEKVNEYRDEHVDGYHKQVNRYHDAAADGYHKQSHRYHNEKVNEHRDAVVDKYHKQTHRYRDEHVDELKNTFVSPLIDKSTVKSFIA